jgi:cytoskeletal protein CcmA (bactofilin family)
MYINNNQSDVEGGRETAVLFKGLTGSGQIHTLSQINASHYGDGIDEMGKFAISVNDGTALMDVFTATPDGIFMVGDINSTTGNASFEGDITVGGSATFNGSTVYNGGYNVTGDSTIDGTLTLSKTAGTGLDVYGGVVVGETLSVTGQSTFSELANFFSIDVSGSSTMQGSLTVTGDSTLGVLNADSSTLLSANVTNDLTVGTSGTFGGSVGVTGDLTVSGSSTMQGSLAVTGDSTLGVLNASSSTFLSATVTNDLTVGTSGTFGGSLGVTGDLTASASVSVGNALTVVGASSLASADVSSSLTVHGSTTTEDLTVNSTLSVVSDADITGSLVANSTFAVTGTSTFSSLTTHNAGISVAGAATYSGEVTLSQTTGTSLHVTANADMGSLSVTGQSVFTDLTTHNAGISVTGASSITGALTVTSLAVNDTSMFTGSVVVNSTVEATDTLTLSKTSGNGLVVIADASVGGDLAVTGNLIVNGTTTTIDSVTLTVADKNIELGTVDAPTDITADGGGLTLKGTTDKTITYMQLSDSWDFSEKVNVSSGKDYSIGNSVVLSSEYVNVDNAVYLGAMDVDGSWRITFDATTGLMQQKRENGVWVTKYSVGA